MNAAPVLVTAPTAPPVELADLKLWLRVTHDAEDALITQLGKAAVGHLDGWKGILGRAIMPQTWAEEFDAPGVLRLSMPDVSAVVVTALDDNDAPVTVTKSDLGLDVIGPYVDVELAGQAAVVRVQYTCGMTGDALETAKLLVQMLVGHFYVNRSAVVTGTIAGELPLALSSIAGQLAWVRW